MTPQEERVWWEGRRVHADLQEAAQSEESGTATQDPRYREERDQRRAETLAAIEDEYDGPVTSV